MKKFVPAFFALCMYVNGLEAQIGIGIGTGGIGVGFNLGSNSKKAAHKQE